MIVKRLDLNRYEPKILSYVLIWPHLEVTKKIIDNNRLQVCLLEFHANLQSTLLDDGGVLDVTRVVYHRRGSWIYRNDWRTWYSTLPRSSVG